MSRITVARVKHISRSRAELLIGVRDPEGGCLVNRLRERRIALVETLGAVNGFGLRMELMPLHECSSSLAIRLNSLMKMSKRTPYNSKPEIWSNSGENKEASTWKDGASKAKQQSCFETDGQQAKASARVATSCMGRSGARGVESSAVSATDSRGASYAGAHSSQKRMRRSHAQSCQ